MQAHLWGGMGESQAGAKQRDREKVASLQERRKSLPDPELGRVRMDKKGGNWTLGS